MIMPRPLSSAAVSADAAGLPSPRRRTALAAAALAGAMSAFGLSGCSLLGARAEPEAPSAGAAKKTAGASASMSAERRSAGAGKLGPTAQAAAGRASAAVKAGASPIFTRLPSLALAPSMTIEQQITVRFLPDAQAHGAPASVPPLRAMVLSAPGRLSAVFSAMGLTVWRIDASADGIVEQRSDPAGAALKAEAFLRDFMFVFWSTAAIRAVLAPNASFTEDASARRTERTLTVDGRRVLRALTTSQGRRTLTTLENAAEGYVLTISAMQ